MNKAEQVIQFLENKGVKHIFMVAGGQIMFLTDAIYKSKIKPICCHHEQAAGMAAEAYGRVSGLGVVLVTAGPGAINVINGVVGAYVDSSPLLVISGASEVFRSKKIAELQIAGARDILGKMKLPIEEKAEYYDTLCPGNQICIAADFENTIIGTYRIGKFKETAKDIGKEAALDLIKKGRSDACFDEYSAPYFLLYSSLLPSGSQITVPEVNSTLKEIMLIAEKFLKGKFKIDDNLITWKPKP